MRVELALASSNEGKLREYRALAASLRYEREIEIHLLAGFRELPSFSEDAPTFAENAAGKALHYSRFSEEIVFADDSGLVVAALGGAPGVRSARYAGDTAGDAERNAKLLFELQRSGAKDRTAKFVCVIAAAQRGRMLTVVSDFVEGTIANEPRGGNGFGYDPLFYFASAGKTFAEMTEMVKNRASHRGKAFRKLCGALGYGSRSPSYK